MVDIKGGGVTFYEGMDPALFRLSYGDGFDFPKLLLPFRIQSAKTRSRAFKARITEEFGSILCSSKKTPSKLISA
jgi:hypothetical protein